MRLAKSRNSSRWIAVAIGAAVFCVATVPLVLAKEAPMSAVRLAAFDQAYENPASTPGNSVATAEDEKFLDDLERRGIQFFIDEADPGTGLMPDRTKANGGAGKWRRQHGIGWFWTNCLGAGDHAAVD